MTFLSIGQVATEVGVTVETIRYYESEGLLDPPDRSPSRYRRYSADAVQRMRFIMRAKEHGFTLKEIAGLIGLYDSQLSTRHEVRQAMDKKIAAVETQIGDLRAIADLLRHLRTACDGCKGCEGPSRPAKECPILMTIAGIGLDSEPQTHPTHAGEET